MTIKVLISDKLSEAAVNVFVERGIEVDYQPDLGKDKEKLLSIINDYDGLAIRSTTKVTPKILENSKKLKIIGRAGIGVDNVDVKEATTKGIIVMNTPFGNSITTAEHAITMMLSLARQIPEADQSTRSGKWEKNKFMGTEITGKTLGVIGCGNIGSIVIDRAKGLHMKVIGFDPYLNEERAKKLGVEKVSLNDVFKRSDFITLHTPLTNKTRNIIDEVAISSMKNNVRIINCARGGLIDEKALLNALKTGKVAGAAIDVYSEEPAINNPLFEVDNVICTPHLGASTIEAQENVAIQIAEQMSDYLLTGAITNAINFPSVTAEEAPILKPYLSLAQNLGLFSGQITETAILSIKIEYVGDISNMNTKALTASAVTGVLKPLLEDINMVNSVSIAKLRGIASAYASYISLTIKTERQERSISGTVFSDKTPRIIQINGIDMEAKFAKNMIYITNQDKPGFIGLLGTSLGLAEINIANFQLGRDVIGGDAIALIEIDESLSDEMLKNISSLKNVIQVKPLAFDLL
jgi:D-3-phosphoglycerate dehydrogenase / 2-oxoglutarate reductase